ncbi:MAG: hypothetical protein J7M17_03710 [Anaerolineae bacterium]|nr:hypothetical protein [Anaerolineae bacterium]
MFKNRILARVLMAVVIIGLLIAGGVLVYRAGWSQGYVATGGAEGVIAPYMPHGFVHPGRPLGFARFVFGAGLFFLLFVGIGHLFRLLTWRRMPAGGPWAGQRPYGPVPPWCRGWEKPHEEQAGSGASTGDADRRCGQAVPAAQS